MPGEAKFLSHPEAARLFVQEGIGQPWYWCGAVTVSGIQIEPRQLQYTRKITAGGIEISTIPRIPDPTAFTVLFKGNYAKFQSLHAAILRQGCVPNFFLASAECRDKNKVMDPSYNSNGAMLFGCDVASPYSFFNGTAVQGDPNQSADREDQLQFSFGSSAWVRAYTYGLQATNVYGTPATPIAMKSLAIVDRGSCPDYVCRPCGNSGCNQLVGTDLTNFYFSTDGGSTWTKITGASGTPIGAYAFNEIAFLVTSTNIYLYSGLDANANAIANWTTATANVSFDLTCGIVQIDPLTFVVGGTDGAVWRSSNGGRSWTQIRADLGHASGYDTFQALNYNRQTNQVVAVTTYVAGSEWYIEVSTDRGKTFTKIGSHVDYAAPTTQTSTLLVNCAGPMSYAVIEGKLYRLSCTADVTDYEEVVVVGASGLITGLGYKDPEDGNQLFLTAVSSFNWSSHTGTGKVVKTLDGFNTSEVETLPIAVVGTDNNPVLLCDGRYGVSVWFVFDTQIVYGRDWESFFIGD